MSTVWLQKENNAKSTLDGAITNVATTLTVQAGEGARFPSSGDFMLALWTRSAFADPVDDTGHAEIVKCTSRSTDSLTIVRAQEGTTGYAHADGETVMLTWTKAQATEYEAAINERLPEAGGSTYDTDDAKIAFTSLGGICARLTNKTGSNSVAGEVVIASTGTDDAVALTGADESQPIGVFLDDGVADGDEAWIVTGDIADVMIEDGSTATRGYWVRTSITDAGRADITNAAPPGGGTPELDRHMAEIGHCLESKGSGTDVLARCVLHLN